MINDNVNTLSFVFHFTLMSSPGIIYYISYVKASSAPFLMIQLPCCS